MNDTLATGEKKAAGLIWAYCFLVASVILLICSKSSPFYPINDWTDANIYFSMGKGMAEGQVIYRDLYDHKGPLLYGLHAICTLFFSDSFLGVWIMEALAGAFFLYFAWKTIALNGCGKVALFCLPVLAMLIFSSFSFLHGDSAEELCLPLLMSALYYWMRYEKETCFTHMPLKIVFWQGFFAGCILWVKFSMLGLHGMWIFLLFVYLAAQGKWREAWKTAFWFLLGMAVATLPWAIYFAAKGAMVPWLKTYLYDNLFLYSGSEPGLGLLGAGKMAVKTAWEWFAQNLRYTLFIAGGLFWMLGQREKTVRGKISILLLLGFSALGAFVGGKEYPYYGLILSVFAVFGWIPLCSLFARWGKNLCSKGLRVALMVLVSILSLGGAYSLSLNVPQSFLTPKENTMQYKLAAIMVKTPGATLLNYGFMDSGFYLAARITPHLKYFHQTNVPLQEMLDEQVRYVEEGLADYVVTRGKQPENILLLYDCVAEAEAPAWFWYPKVYLYRLKTLAP